MTRPSRLDVHVWLVTAGLAITALALWWGGPSLPQLEPSLWWPLLVVLFAVTERYVVHIPFGQDNQSLSFIEAPLLLGLLFASTQELVFAGLLGIGLALSLLLRSAPIKVTFNLSLWLAQSTAAIFVFTGMLRLLGTENDPLAPAGWLAALVATQAAHVLSGLAVAGVIAIRQRSWEGRAVLAGLARGAVGTVVVTDLALVTALILRREPMGLALVSVLAALSFLLYRGYHVQRLRYGRLELLYAFTRSADQSLLEGSVQETVVAEARALLRARGSTIFVLNDDAAAAWWKPALDGSVLRLPRGRHGEPAEVLQGTGHIDAMAAPLYEAGRVVGVLAVTDRVDDVSTFDADDAKLLQALAGHASVALANNALVDRVRSAAEQTEHLSLHDPLTGLPNRLHFHQRLARRLEATGSAAVLLMDLDRFKEVNDTLGHDVGDQLLRQVGQRLLALEHDETFVARMGGDEFAVMLTGDEVHVEGMVQRISRDFSRPIRLDDIELDVSASIGIAVAPQDGSSAALLMRRAEVAMYDAKRGLAGVEHYASDRDPYSARRLSLISDLARALEDNRLELHYQPQAEPGTGRVTGVEALLRWRHPVWGSVPPDEFIPLAEHTGLIRPLTRFVLETAVHQCAAWQAAGTPVVMAVNVSMRNLLEPDFADVVARLLVQANLPAGLLKIEVTESAIIADPERALHALDKLVALGLSISVDDFGTGYSSLTRLRRLPVHEVKIDRGFVRHLAQSTADLAIVRAVISLGHDLGLRVVAEGVEDERTWSILDGLSCDLLQGFLLARPMAAEDMSRWLVEHFDSFATRLRTDTPPTGEDASRRAATEEKSRRSHGRGIVPG
ncbi:MAG: EAL domain-containing protein [Sporichthyaceae bacterium]